MITARNYAAQAEMDLRIWEKGNLSPKKAEYVSSLIKESVHFALPDGGLLFDDKLKGLRGAQLRLPFNNITVEWYDDADTGGAPKKILVSAVEVDVTTLEKLGFLRSGENFNGETAIIMSVCAEAYSKKWRLMPLWFVVDSIWDEYHSSHSLNIRTGKVELIERGKDFDGIEGILMPMMRFADSQEENDSICNAWGNLVVSYCRSVFELCEALSCANVTTDIIQPASPKNAKRISDKKLPIYETRCLSIIVPSTTSSSSGGLGGTHRSPRQHLRRGHIRRIAEDRKIWVTSCVVGAKSQGVIEKTYTVSS